MHSVVAMITGPEWSWPLQTANGGCPEAISNKRKVSEADEMLWSTGDGVKE